MGDTIEGYLLLDVDKDANDDRLVLNLLMFQIYETLNVVEVEVANVERARVISATVIGNMAKHENITLQKRQFFGDLTETREKGRERETNQKNDYLPAFIKADSGLRQIKIAHDQSGQSEELDKAQALCHRAPLTRL